MSEARVVAPAAVRELAEALESAGFETWCVGGAVRDALLGIRHLDWDLATAATPEQVAEVFGRRRTIPVGLKHGTIGVRDSAGVMHEVTTFRRDVRTDGRHAEVEFGVSLEDDLARRDFTINAIAVHPLRNELRDPFGGRADLAAGVVRAVGDAGSRMHEDRLRALRAIRFAARFGFKMEERTWKAVVESASALNRLSAERVQQEIVKTMDQVRRPAQAFRLWRDSGALGTLVPLLAHAPDECLAALDCVGWPEATTLPELSGSRQLTRLAVLFSCMPATSVPAALKALRFSGETTGWIGALVDRWRRLKPALDALVAKAGATDGEIRRLVADAGRTRFAPLMRLATARWYAGAGAGPPRERVVALYRRGVRIAFRDPIELADLAVDGDDLIGAGLPSGPPLGQILRHLLDAVIDDPARNTREELLALARRDPLAS